MCMREECVYACMRLAILFADSKAGRDAGLWKAVHGNAH